MNLQTIAEHTVDIDLLTGGIVIDAGCLGFQFSEAMTERGLNVLAFDVQPLKPPGNPRINFSQCAIDNHDGMTAYKYNEKDPQATCIDIDGKPIISVDIFRYYADHWKLDIEGSEYFILLDSRLSFDLSVIHLPKQITVEFHKHVDKNRHHLFFNKCIANLSVNYTAVQHERTAQHGAGMNWWDSLFIRKDLL